jgi:SAM-dependent methyltransferase
MTASAPMHNDDADWDQWPVSVYLDTVYREVYPSDAAVIDHHSRVYRDIAPGSLDRTLEFGTGPNLYPLMLAAAASRRIDAIDYSRPNVEYLRQQLRDGPDLTWQAFYTHCRERNPALPRTLTEALSRVHVIHGNALAVPEDTYDLASMHFVAESVTERADEFDEFCRVFARSVRPGGHLIAAFMEMLPRYRLGAGPEWPGYPIDAAMLHQVLAPHAEDLDIVRIGPDNVIAEHDSAGMLLVSARRRS